MPNLTSKKIVILLFVVLLLTIFVVIKVWMDRSVILSEWSEISFDFNDTTVDSSMDTNANENTSEESLINNEPDNSDENNENNLESSFNWDSQEDIKYNNETDVMDGDTSENNDLVSSWAISENISHDANFENYSWSENISISLDKKLDWINRYKFEWKIGDSFNIDKIMVSWIYDWNESDKYKLSKYSLWDDFFNYFASLDLWNLDFWENKYRFYFYDWNELIWIQDDVIYIDKILRQDDLCSNWFCIDMNDYVNVSDDDNYISQTKNWVEIKYDIDNNKIFVDGTNSNWLIK